MDWFDKIKINDEITITMLPTTTLEQTMVGVMEILIGVFREVFN